MTVRRVCPWALMSAKVGFMDCFIPLESTATGTMAAIHMPVYQCVSEKNGGYSLFEQTATTLNVHHLSTGKRATGEEDQKHQPGTRSLSHSPLSQSLIRTIPMQTLVSQCGCTFNHLGSIIKENTSA